MITREKTADMIASYLHHEITLTQLVDWSENAIMDGNFAEQDISVLSRVLSRIGLADVRAFGLTWEDCEDMLKQLGFATHPMWLQSNPSPKANGGGEQEHTCWQ